MGGAPRVEHQRGVQRRGRTGGAVDLSAGDQHPAVVERGGGVEGARRGGEGLHRVGDAQLRSVGEQPGGRVERLGAGERHLHPGVEAVAAGDQHLAVRQQGGGVAGAGRRKVGADAGRDRRAGQCERVDGAEEDGELVGIAPGGRHGIRHVERRGPAEGDEAPGGPRLAGVPADLHHPAGACGDGRELRRAGVGPHQLFERRLTPGP